MSVFRLARIVEIILLTIETASFFVSIYILFLALGLMLMTFLAMNIWAPYNIRYKDFSEAFISILLLSMGQLEFDELSKNNFVWSYLFIVVYYIFIIYLLLNAFFVIYIDSYRRILL
jgi:hypothetical protein